MAKKAGNYKIPFREGNLQSYPYNPDEWRDNYEFDDTLEYVTYYRGRSSATLEFVDSHGKKYEMFMSDFHDVMTSLGFRDKEVSGRWTFVKKGQNYGIKAVLG